MRTICRFSYADVASTIIQFVRLGRRPEELASPPVCCTALLEALEGAVTSTWPPIDNYVLALCGALGISADAPPELVWARIGVSLYQLVLEQTARSRRGRKKGSVAKQSKDRDDYFIALTESLTGSRVVDPVYIARNLDEADFRWLSDLGRLCSNPVDPEIILKKVVRKFEGTLPVAHRTTHLSRIRRKWRTRCKSHS
jgi:hypothetical protein